MSTVHARSSTVARKSATQPAGRCAHQGRMRCCQTKHQHNCEVWWSKMKWTCSSLQLKPTHGTVLRVLSMESTRTTPTLRKPQLAIAPKKIVTSCTTTTNHGRCGVTTPTTLSVSETVHPPKRLLCWMLMGVYPACRKTSTCG